MKVILVSNLLLLFVVGITSIEFIGMHKRLRDTYRDADFFLLVKILSKSTHVIVTPNTLTETSNLIKFIMPPARELVYERYRSMVKSPDIHEILVDSKYAVDQTEFIRLGLADVVVLYVGNDSTVLLTADFDLYLATLNKGLKAENFNHFRDL